MKVAVMQPYFYPYVGYFELIQEVDVFVFLTDAQFNRKGYINRNKIRNNNGGTQQIIVPVKRSPQKSKIYEISINDQKWHKKFMRKLSTTYGKKFEKNPLLEDLEKLKNFTNLCDLNMFSIKSICKHIKINSTFVDSRSLDVSSSGQQRMIDICNKLKADTYINLPGGRGLYKQDLFERNGLKLIIKEMTKCENKNSILDLVLND